MTSVKSIYLAVFGALMSAMSLFLLLENWSTADGTCGSLLRPVVLRSTFAGEVRELGWWWSSDKLCELSMTARGLSFNIALVIGSGLSLFARYSDRSKS